MFGIGCFEMLVVLVVPILLVLPFWKIFEKAGFPPWWSLLMVISPVNIVLLFYLAFAEWPAFRQRKEAN